MKTAYVYVLVLMVFIMGCEPIFNSGEPDPEVIDVVDNVDIQATVEDILDENELDHDSETPRNWNRENAQMINLLGQSVSEDIEGVSFSNQKLLIATEGIFRLTGTLDDARIVVDAEDETEVILVLDGVTVHCSYNAPLYVMNAGCTIIDLVEGTDNYFSDGDSYTFDNQDEDEPNAAIFSKDDLTITGEGSISVTGNYEDGIASKDGLVIKGGTFNVQAADDGIRGKDYLVIKDGIISIDAGGDGLKSTNDEDEDRGYIYIASGNLDITSQGDAIHALTDALIKEVNLVAKTGGGASSSTYSSASAKAIKGLVYNVIDGGIFSINALDDAIHSNDVMIINGGSFTIATGDDGFHADELLIVNGGEIEISECYEGLESAIIDITAANINVVSSDDGINISAGNDGSGMRPGGGGPGGPGGQTDQFASTGDYYLFIEGGYIAVNSSGDGLDANGAIVMSEGKVIIDGPSSNGNGTLDFSSFQMNGGFLLGTGSSGMAQAPGSSSDQYSVMVVFRNTLQAGTPVHLSVGSGEDLFTYSPSKNYQSVVFSSPDLKSGESYQIYYGGTISGELKDGLLTDGTYSAGNQYREFSLNGITTLVR